VILAKIREIAKVSSLKVAGAFTLVQGLNYEQQSRYSFMISANFTDGTVAFADVEVIVEDVNDVCPKFTSSEFVVYHTEPQWRRICWSP